MISQKMLQLGKQASVIRTISEYGAKRKKEIGAENVYDFSLGNPSIPAPDSIGKAIAELVAEMDPCQLHGYTSSAGDMGVRSAIAQSVRERFGFEADPAMIYMTCGAAASLTCSLHALLNAGDEVVVPAPFFPEYRVFVEKAGGVLVPVLCHQPSFQLDLEAMEAAINEKTKVVMLNSPNNPTGAVYSEESLQALCAILEKKETELGTEIYLLCDEPYRELYYGKGTLPWLPNLYDRTVVAYSYSKSLSLPGERIGYILVSPRMENAGDVFAAVCGAGRSLGFVCAPSLWQRVIAKCLGETANVEEYRENCRILSEALTEQGYTVTPPEGAFYLFVKSPEEDANVFCEKAKKYELLLVPSDSFGVKGFVRIAYCVSRKTITDSIPAFRRLMEEYK
ncbi:MAG: pyridoxal phosphate-dependent aminotransferase [Ruminococcaceae bacterium]|nr:pyridoxal phosphate-dependent aminotransferase [Oscillospiraceae bacterium]